MIPPEFQDDACWPPTVKNWLRPIPTIKPPSLFFSGFSFGGAGGFLCVLSFTTGLRTGVARLSFFFGMAARADESGGPAAGTDARFEGEPAPGKSTPGKPATGKPVPGERAVVEPVVVKPVSGESVVVDPIAGDPAFGDFFVVAPLGPGSSRRCSTGTGTPPVIGVGVPPPLAPEGEGPWAILSPTGTV